MSDKKIDSTTATEGNTSTSPNNTYKNKQVMDYYSGSQASVYIGDIFVDDAALVSYDVQSAMIPIYGFRSVNYDLVLQGNYIVKGTLSINFKEAGYLYILLNEYNKRTGRKNQFNMSDDKILLNGQNTNAGSKNLTSQYRITAEELLQIEASRNGKVRKVSELDLNSPAAAKKLTSSIADIKGGPRQVFEDTAEAFENRFWQEANTTDSNPGGTQNYVGREGPQHNTAIFGLQQTPFNITMTYGDFSSDLHNHTLNVIKDITLTGVSKIVDTSDRPLQEVYTFFARQAY